MLGPPSKRLNIEMNIPKIKHTIPILGNTSRYPALLVILSILAGCASPKTFVAYDGPCPLRPHLEPITAEQQQNIDPDVLSVISDNQLKLKQHIKLLEAVSGCQTP